MKLISLQEEPKDHGLAFKIACPICGKTQLWHLMEVKTSFAVCHLSLLPCKSKHMMVCPVCKHYIDLTAQMYRRLRTIADIRSDYFKRRLTNVKYQERMAKKFPVIFNELCAYLKKMAKKSRLPVSAFSPSKITEDDLKAVFKSNFINRGEALTPAGQPGFYWLG